MPRCEVLLVLWATTFTGALIGALLVVASNALSKRVLVGDLTDRMDAKEVRNPRLIDLQVRTGYIVTATGCLIIALSAAAALAGVLILLVSGGRFSPSP
jgi:hypothetical protein